MRDKVCSFVEAVSNGKLTSEELRVTEYSQVIISKFCTVGYSFHIFSVVFNHPRPAAGFIMFSILIVFGCFWCSRIPYLSFFSSSKELVAKGGLRADQITRMLVPALLEKSDRLLRGKSRTGTSAVHEPGLQEWQRNWWGHLHTFSRQSIKQNNYQCIIYIPSNSWISCSHILVTTPGKHFQNLAEASQCEHVELNIFQTFQCPVWFF